MDIGDKNDQNQHRIVVTNTIRLQHPPPTSIYSLMVLGTLQPSGTCIDGCFSEAASMTLSHLYFTVWNCFSKYLNYLLEFFKIKDLKCNNFTF